ncbi:histidinol-phosphate transaminase [Lutimaribacter sp. EGI FJ00015]|uniref:Histidinol-phosphate transaminase n=1 Tax=Lutimaribacter degradans TaxID=2945989 RepID=A0ACC5ZX22_9RHOB|nr:histidinol-phosphate transaminase [Lutimaribacter sp. EGI FJ00013]MCM2562650.1 histidinol-phosphate transaminase [Lutimaribacter sp. EGI FJ00013]MCO0613807.1 histidinol-phosphate transaminase [Lutimaribacter sp. EGI FJ00015]MCO0636710.1 histidinol-phosphate transaminase [Lutimaribacter sp. EGI FJ00014]
MTKITPQPGILDIAPYVGGASQVAGRTDAVKLSSNENPFGPSEAAIEAFRRAGFDLHRYPPTDHAALRGAIADAHGLDAARIICGVGSDEILHLLCQAYAGPGDEVIHTEHGFAIYRIGALAAGATPVEVAENERTTDVDAILAACGPATRLVFIANPNNPTGTMIGAEEVQRLADGIPDTALLVLDGAYAEYVEGFDGGAALVDQRDNVVMTRTFSKIYGLGGLRVGWGYGPAHVIDVLNRIRGPFNLSGPALAAAEAAVKDQAWVAKCRADNRRLRAWLIDVLEGHGVPCDPSEANFILARFTDADEAEACNAYLLSQGLIVRSVAGYNLPACLRITIGDEASCRRVAHAIGQFKEGAR